MITENKWKSSHSVNQSRFGTFPTQNDRLSSNGFLGLRSKASFRSADTARIEERAHMGTGTAVTNDSATALTGTVIF